MHSIFENCGLIYELLKEIDDIMPWFGEKTKSREDFLTIRQVKFQKLHSSHDWLTFIKDKKLTPLNRAIEYNIINLFDRIDEEEGDSNEWKHWILKLDTVLSSCLYDEFGRGLPESQNKGFQIVRVYYEFLRKIYEHRGLEIPEPFDVEPITRFMRHQSERGKIIRKFQIKKMEIAKRPACPRCGAKGANIGLWSNNRYRCKECDKTFSRKRKH